jgi:O-antigen/teichoic acid export membrane protein
VEAEKDENNLTAKLVQSSIWIFAKIVVVNIFNVFVIAILARRLTPAQFGIVALAGVVLKLITVIGSQGISEFVINDNEEGRESRLSSAFWMDLLFSLGATLLGLALTSPIARFFNEPELKWVLSVLFLNFTLDSFAKIPDALLKKGLKFKQLEIRNVILSFLSGTVSIAMALNGFGVWSLVIPATIITPIKAIITFRLCGWYPDFNFNIKVWPRIFKYSSYVIGGTLTSFLITEGDSLLIGKFMGSAALGIYNLAWRASNLVVKNINVVVGKIGLPAFSLLKQDIPQLRLALNRMMRIISMTSVPILILIFVIADDFILTIYGPQWVDSIILLRILIIFVLRFTIGNPTGMIYKTINRPDITFKFGLALIPFYFLSIWLGSYYGLIGIAVGLTIVRTLSGIVDFWIVGKCLDTTLMGILRPVIPAFQASFLMGGMVYTLKHFIENFYGINHLFNLLFLGICGGIIYLLLIRVFFKGIGLDLTKISASVLGKHHIYIKKLLNT